MFRINEEYFKTIAGKYLTEYNSFDFKLREAVIQKKSASVKLLLFQGANVNAKDKQGETLLDLALKQDHDANRTEILKSLLRAGVYLPRKQSNLKFLLTPQPKAELIEYYNPNENRFIPADDLKIKEQLKTSKKDAVVLFFAEYDKEPGSEYFGAVKQFYADSYQTRGYYRALNDFTIFRVIINNSQQLQPILVKINSLLPPTQEIQHFMIHGHANNIMMQLSDDFIEQYSFLYSNDADRNNSAMEKALGQLGKHGTAALFGCLAADGQKNMTKEFSKKILLKEGF